jgi:hypothetical protein
MEARTFMTAREVTTVVNTDTYSAEGKECRDFKRAGKVFGHLVDKAAFVDTITLSVDCGEKPRLEKIVERKSDGIMSRQSNYARMVRGKWIVTGNPVTILYGKVNRFSGVPPCRLTVRSEATPVTGAQVNKLVQSIFPAANDVRVSLVELTFDVSTFSFSDVYSSVLYRAMHTRSFGNERHGRTIEIGSPRSLWFASIYEKKESVLRVEFKLRRGFLSSKGMNSANDLVGMRSLQLEKLLSLRKFRRTRINAATQGWPEVARDWYLRSDTRPKWLLHRMARAHGLNPNYVLPKSMNQRQLESMQRQLVW